MTIRYLIQCLTFPLRIRRRKRFISFILAILIFVMGIINIVNYNSKMCALFYQDISCEALMSGDEHEFMRVKKFTKICGFPSKTDADFRRQLKNCTFYKQANGYNRVQVSNEELEFPIAYAILVHREPVQVAKLLRAIYREYNTYCIHIDRKSPATFQSDIRNLANCFPNVFVASRLESVIYAEFSRLQADLNCMEDSLRFSKNWKYYINLAGEAFPLKTNLQIVRHLKRYNNSNAIEMLLPIKYRYDKIWKAKYLYKRLTKLPKRRKRLVMVKTGIEHDPAPPGVRILKGSAYGAFTRKFVNYLLTDSIAKQVLEWTRDTYSPDEQYWATMNNIFLNLTKKTLSNRFRKQWNEWTQLTYISWKGQQPCHGKRVRDICIFGVRDLPTLANDPSLFANKFYHSYQPLTLQCLESKLQAQESSLKGATG